LLAYSSARAFLVQEAELRQRRVLVENVVTNITVVNRGSDVYAELPPNGIRLQELLARGSSAVPEVVQRL
jgi:hypothetical protein